MSRALWQPAFILNRLLFAMADPPLWHLEQVEKQGNGPLRDMHRSGGRQEPACKPGDEQSTCSQGDRKSVFLLQLLTKTNNGYCASACKTEL